MEKAGFNSVAPLGTAVSQEQLNLLGNIITNQLYFLTESSRQACFYQNFKFGTAILRGRKSLSFIFPDNSEDPDTILNQTNGKI